MYKRQVIKAALNVQAKHPEWTMVPEIMIPLVGEVKELAYVKKVVVEKEPAVLSLQAYLQHFRMPLSH